MPRTETFSVHGYRELMRACKQAPRDTRLYVRHTFRDVGEAVRSDADARFSHYDARSAAGFKVAVRQKGVMVYQAIRKTTGLRPDYGSLQMRKGLLPALASKREETEAGIEHALDKVARNFERGGP